MSETRKCDEVPAHLWHLMDALLNDTISDAEISELESLLVEDAAAARTFLEYSQTHAELHLLSIAHKATRNAVRPERLAVPSRRRSESTSGNVPATPSEADLAAAAKPSPPAAVPFPFNLLYLTGDTPVASALLWLVMLFGAGLVIMVFAMLVVSIRGIHVTVEPAEVAKAPAVKAAPPVVPEAPQPEMVARLLRALDCQWTSAKEAPSAGDDLAVGQHLQLKAGLAEIAFQGGAKVILQGPANLEVGSRSSAYLHHGTLTATVENPLAKGFEIRAPGMRYTDLGTEFGVLVAKNGAQEVHVFRGRVQAEQSGQWSVVGSQNTGIASATPVTRHSPAATIVLVANEALRITAPDKPIQRIVADEQKFARTMPEPKSEPFPLFSTGVGLEPGAVDPHWEIVAESDAPDFRPRPAVVSGADMQPGPPGETAKSLSDANPPRSAPDACRWTIRTHFDLAGFDPTTAVIEGQYLADDFLDAISLNGTPILVPPHSPRDSSSGRWTPLKITKGFVAGANTLEIVLENSTLSAPGKLSVGNAMTWCVQWRGTARKTIKNQ
jgi:hypothetical protein